MKYDTEWEYIQEFSFRRMKVPGGWIVNSYTVEHNSEMACESMCFVPDPKHEWEIK